MRVSLSTILLFFRGKLRRKSTNLLVEYHLHEFILALWGMPLGEMLDLERLALRCKELGKYTFFFTSSPANVPGGVSSHVNGQAIL